MILTLILIEDSSGVQYIVWETLQRLRRKGRRLEGWAEPCGLVAVFKSCSVWGVSGSRLALCHKGPRNSKNTLSTDREETMQINVSILTPGRQSLLPVYKPMCTAARTILCPLCPGCREQVSPGYTHDTFPQIRPALLLAWLCCCFTNKMDLELWHR
jgi:hypothetical protein